MPSSRPKRSTRRKTQRSTARSSRPTAKRKAVIKKTAKTVALSFKETKRHQEVSTAGTEMWDNTTKWIVFRPLELDRSTTDSETQRQSNHIYMLNCRLRIDIETNPISVSPYFLRFVLGWAKGDVSYPVQKTPLEMCTATAFTTAAANHYSDFDKDDYKIISDQLIRVTPKQIFDQTSYQTTGEATGLSNDNRGLWPQVTRNFNFKFNRRYKYEGDSSGELVGWHPFIAIQLDRTKFGNAHTGPTGSNPSPNMTYELTSYFKDIN